MEIDIMPLKDYDDELLKINNLKWLPWIGKEFHKTGLLIIGDSFYSDGEGWPDNDPFAPRSMIMNQGLSSHKPEFRNRGLLQAVENIILGQSSTNLVQRNKFWTSVAYYNLVQRVLPSRDSKPNDNDFDIGWGATLPLLETIKPKFCLKLAVRGIGRLGFKLTNGETGWEYKNEEFYKKPLVINLNKNNHNLKMLAVNHPTGSFGFKPDYWSAIINETMPELRINLK